MSKNTSRILLINEFESAPESTLFDQRTLATSYCFRLLN